MVDVEVVLDLRGVRNAPSTPEGFADLWAGLEPTLIGRQLSHRDVHELQRAEGHVRIEVVRLPDGACLVDVHTRFAIVAVRETARLRYRCAHCSGAGRYGPFICTTCPSNGDNRVCDEHVVILDGALVATCPRHRPVCEGCGASAEFRCAGKACGRQRAWCGAHRRRHLLDPDISYCPPCYDETFPSCATERCSDIGSVSCEHVSRDFRRCGRRMCTRHALRWQVFGGERMGLGRCITHRQVLGVSVDELMFQIVAGVAARGRKERMPGLRGFAYNVRRGGNDELALDYPWIYRTLGALAREADTRTAAALAEMRPVWDREIQGIDRDRQVGLRLVESLRGLVPAALTDAIQFADYIPPSQRGGVTLPARLFVKVPENLRSRFIGQGGANIKSYRQRLGLEVQIEGGGRR